MGVFFMKKSAKRFLFKAFFFCFVLFSLFLLFGACMGRTLRRQTLSYAVPAVKNRITLMISREAESALTAEDNDFLSVLARDSEGQVTSLSLNMAAVNRVKNKLSASLSEKTDGEKGSMTVAIPFGNLFGTLFLSGRGPLFHVRLEQSGAVKTDLVSEFADAGINQTLHRVLLTVESDYLLLLPLKSESVTVKTDVLLSETVIVGRVPDAFTDISRFSEDSAEELIIDDIYDYGASLTE